MLESTTASEFILKDINKYCVVSVETGFYDASMWIKTREKEYTEVSDSIIIHMDAYDCVRITTAYEIPHVNYSIVRLYA